MARRVSVELQDDLDGGKASETVSFGLDRAAYELDLSGQNAANLRKLLKPYLDAGRRIGRLTRPKVNWGRPSNEGSGVDHAAVRQWASASGIDIGSRGRIPARVIEQYQAVGR